jgi:hypothetical protein
MLRGGGGVYEAQSNISLKELVERLCVTEVALTVDGRTEWRKETSNRRRDLSGRTMPS